MKAVFDYNKIPDLSEEEHKALAEHDEAHAIHSARVMGTGFPSPYRPDDSDEARQLIERSNKRMQEAYEALSRLAPEETPGRSDGLTYSKLLEIFCKHGLGERDGILASDPSIPWDELPAPRLLMYCMLDLDEYFFLTKGAPGAPHLPRLYDIPERVRASLTEEQIAAAHGGKNELLIRLYRILGNLGRDSGQERQRSMNALGYECGYDLRVFYNRYQEDQDYTNGFVEGALELAGEEVEDEEEREIVDLMESLWEDPALTLHEKHEQVLEPLKLDCRVTEDEGQLWRL